MNYLSKNIRYLRKSKKWSQEELAGQLGVKRSSIAAYESKNVRPRLDFIVDLSKLFKVRMADLIEKDLESSSAQTDGADAPARLAPQRLRLDFQDEQSLRTFIERSVRIRKMLEGFKVFYRFKLENIERPGEDSRRLCADIENFLLLLEHLLVHNETIIKTISQNLNRYPES